MTDLAVTGEEPEAKPPPTIYDVALMLVEVVQTQRSALRASRAEVERARFVAQEWADASQGFGWTITRHALAMVLAALDGETDPKQVGLTPDAHDAYRALSDHQETLRGDQAP